MTLHALTWALYADHGDLDPTARLILTVLGDHAGTEGIAWPARHTMAKAAGCSVDTVDRRLTVLRDRGLIREATADETPASWQQMDTRYRPRAYVLALPGQGPQTAASRESRGRNTPAQGPQNPPPGAATVRHKPKEPKQPNARAREADASPPPARHTGPAYAPIDTQALYRDRGNAGDSVAGAAKARAALAEARR